MTAVRGRFAPTPSGYLHIGNAFTALLAWLQIRKQGGTFLLRIEDLDSTRFRPAYAEALFTDLRWLGLDWDEQVVWQKDRTKQYEDAFVQLQHQGLVYSCFCSRAELRAAANAAIAPHGLASEGPVYSGRCRSLNERDRARLSQQKTPAWRYKLPDTGVQFDDLVYGPQSFPPGYGGDFIVRRADGIFAYQLAVVVDDADMGVTHVLRGDDLLDSTPRQLHLYRDLGLQAPTFTHVPLIYDESGERLSKRDHAITISGLREAGMRPERLIGFLAWLAGLLDAPEEVRADELIGTFHVSHLPRQPIHADLSLLASLSHVAP